jgi:hypothetical protein
MADHNRQRGARHAEQDRDRLHLFDGDDVDVGEAAPETDELTDDEMAVISASMADPETPPNGLQAN